MARTLSEKIFGYKGTGEDPAELVTLAAVTATSTELNVLAGVTAGTVTASKALVVGANKDLATIRHLTISGNLVTGSTTLSEAELGVLDAVVAGTVSASKALVVDANKGIGGFRSTGTFYTYGQGAATALNSTGTLTAAAMIGGIVTSTTAAGVTATLDTGSNLETAIAAVYSGVQNNDYFEFSVVNTGPDSFTVATASGWTDGGNAFVAVATATSARFGVRRTGSGTYTIFKIA